jgi:hypothetical protein
MTIEVVASGFQIIYPFTPNLDCNRVILEFDGISGHEFVPYDLPWVVLTTKSRIFFQHLVHASRQCLNLIRATYLSSLRAELILALLGMPHKLSSTFIEPI